MQYTSDKNMLLLLEALKQFEIIRFETEFCRAIGILQPNLAQIKEGKKHFTPEHIRMAVIHYDVNANWIMGAETRIFNKKPFFPTLSNSVKKTKNELIDG